MVAFEIKDKVALITGGASGLGFQYAIEILAKGAKGVTLADINSEVGSKAINEIEKKFGKNKAIFVKTDVSNYEEFENAFKKTVEVFKNVDILINNAGILNDKLWQKEVAINVNGVIHGVILGLETYIPKYKSGPEGLIVNISSTTGVFAYIALPIYCATKFAVHGMTLCWGHPTHYKRTQVRVVGVCPGVTMTPLITEMANKNLGPAYEKIKDKAIANAASQLPEELAPGVIQIIKEAPSGTMWIIEGGQPPYQYVLPNRNEVPKVHLK